MARWQDEIGERRAREGKGTPLGPTLAGFSLFCLLALLLNGESLYRNATLLPYPRPKEIRLPACLFGPSPPSITVRSPVRSIAIALSTQLATISRATRLNQFRARIESLAHSEPRPARNPYP